MRRRFGQFAESRSAFTLTELMIAMGIGFGVIAATFSAYLFITRNGKALEAQIEFANMYRSLYANYTDMIEASSNVAMDDDYRGVMVTSVHYDTANNRVETSVWLGYVVGADVATSRLVVRPNGKDEPDGETVLCSYVSPVLGDDGVESPMFTISGHAVILNAHVGDSTRTGDPDTTGPGRQGLVVSIAASSRNLAREL